MITSKSLQREPRHVMEMTDAEYETAMNEWAQGQDAKRYVQGVQDNRARINQARAQDMARIDALRELIENNPGSPQEADWKIERRMCERRYFARGLILRGIGKNWRTLSRIAQEVGVQFNNVGDLTEVDLIAAIEAHANRLSEQTELSQTAWQVERATLRSQVEAEPHEEGLHPRQRENEDARLAAEWGALDSKDKTLIDILVRRVRDDSDKGPLSLRGIASIAPNLGAASTIGRRLDKLERKGLVKGPPKERSADGWCPTPHAIILYERAYLGS